MRDKRPSEPLENEIVALLCKVLPCGKPRSWYQSVKNSLPLWPVALLLKKSRYLPLSSHDRKAGGQHLSADHSWRINGVTPSWSWTKEDDDDKSAD